MSSTTLMPVDPALSPMRVSRLLTISANLLPEEIIAARRTRRTRSIVLAVAVVVLMATGGWYAHAYRTTTLATTERDEVTRVAGSLTAEQSSYQDVVQVQTEISTLDRQLKAVMADDLPWATLLSSLRTTGDSVGVQVEGITAQLAADTVGGAPPVGSTGSLPSTSKAAVIGSATLGGTAPDKASVARFVDALTKVGGIANPFLTSATQTDENRVEFSLTLDISADSLCGRFTKACKAGGK